MKPINSIIEPSVAGYTPQVACPLNRDVRHKMKSIFITLAIFATLTARLKAEDSAPLSADHMRAIQKRMFKDVQNCDAASKAYRHISIGSPLSAVKQLPNTPPGDPSLRGGDSLVIYQGDIPPPAEWGEYIARTDGQTRRTFYFFHDGEKVVRIAYLDLAWKFETPNQNQLRESEQYDFEPQGPWIMEEEK
jgi:uncharacterized protein YkuJ